MIIKAHVIFYTYRRKVQKAQMDARTHINTHRQLFSEIVVI